MIPFLVLSAVYAVLVYFAAKVIQKREAEALPPEERTPPFGVFFRALFWFLTPIASLTSDD